MELHLEAAQILTRANKREGTLKTLVYSSTYKNLRQLFALVSECIKYQTILEEVVSQCGSSLLDEEVINGDKHLAIVLLYEHLIGKGFGRIGFLRKSIVRHKSTIKSACETILQNHNCSSLRDIVMGKENCLKIPRYARVNLVKCTIQEITEQLQEEGWIYHGRLQFDCFRREIESFSEDTFGQDPLMDDLLVFSPGTDLHNHPLVLSGVIVLQDKASCIPAHVLNPQPNSIVLDCCAAPGNKTCHLASLMGDKGRVIALDRDLKRITTMKALLSRSGYNSVEVIHQDFLTLSPNSEDTSQIEMILVDPSCSGSGMPGARLCPSDDQVDDRRLQSLKRFQISILKHALRFPKAKLVAYSTCSVHQEENEEVVEEVMEHVKEYFRFKPVFPDLEACRGFKKFLHYKDFLRLSPEKDLTLGFFVACFERIKSAEKPASEDQASKGSIEVESKEEDEKQCDTGSDFMTNEEENVKAKKKKKKKQHESPDMPNFAVCMEEGVADSCDNTIEPIKSNYCSVHDEEDSIEHVKKNKKKRKKDKKDKISPDDLSESIIYSETLDENESKVSTNPLQSNSNSKEEKEIREDVVGGFMNDDGVFSKEGKSKKARKRKRDQENEDIDSLKTMMSVDLSFADENSNHTKHKKAKSGKRKRNKSEELEEIYSSENVLTEDSAVRVEKTDLRKERTPKNGKKRKKEKEEIDETESSQGQLVDENDNCSDSGSHKEIKIKRKVDMKMEDTSFTKEGKAKKKKKKKKKERTIEEDG